MADTTIDLRSEALAQLLDLKATLASIISTMPTQIVRPIHFRAQLESMQKNVLALDHAFVSHKYLIQHRHLMLDLATLSDAVRRSNIDNDELLECLHLCWSDVDGLESKFKDSLDPMYWNLRRRHDSTIAQTVFSIPEILEMTLASCDLVDILRMSETCKGVSYIIKASSKLQTQLFLRPAPQHTPQSLLDISKIQQRADFHCCIENDYEGDGQRKLIARITIWMDSNGVYWPEIGERILDMFICQPPIHRLLVRDSCPYQNYNLQNEARDVQMTSETGITVRDLYEMAELWIADHDSCWTSEDYQYIASQDYQFDYEMRFKECLSEVEWAWAADQNIAQRP